MNAEGGNGQMRRSVRWLTSAVLPVSVIALLETTVRMGLFPPTLSAAPSTIVSACYDLIADGVLVKHTGLSLYRIAVGVSIGTVVGLFLGMSAAISARLDHFLSPTIGFLAPIPAVVWLPFSIMLFGVGEAYKISLAAFVTFLLVYIQTFQGVRHISKQYIELAQMYEKSTYELVTRILVPASLPSCVMGLRVALAISWIAILFVEASSAEKDFGGLGWFIADAREVGRIEDQFAGVLILGVVGYVSDALIGIWQRSKLSWSSTLEDTVRW